MNDPDRVEPAVLDFELAALAEVARDWARDAAKGRRIDDLCERTVGFRNAVLGKLKANRELVPREIVSDEYDLVYHAVKWCKANRDEANEAMGVPYDVGHGRPVFRPLPWPKVSIEALLGIGTPTEIAREITAARLSVGESTVRNSRRDRYRVAKPTTAQKLLASVFLDLCRERECSTIRAILAEILDSLLVSGYPRLCLYYLVQEASDTRGPTGTDPCTEEFRKELCELVRGHNTKMGPFTKLDQCR